MLEPSRRVVPGQIDVPGAEILGGQRASDAERTRVIRHLGQCHADGRISGDVFTARMEAAAECPTQAGLLALLDDLPAMVAPRQKIAVRARRLFCGVLAQRAWFTAGAVAALCWAIIPATVIFTATGYPVTYHAGRDVWVQTEHPGLALMFVVLFIITGVVALAWDLALWYRAESP